MKNKKLIWIIIIIILAVGFFIYFSTSEKDIDLRDLPEPAKVPDLPITGEVIYPDEPKIPEFPDEESLEALEDYKPGEGSDVLRKDSKDDLLEKSTKENLFRKIAKSKSNLLIRIILILLILLVTYIVIRIIHKRGKPKVLKGKPVVGVVSKKGV